MSSLSDPSETDRRAQDSGRVNRAWRWFSSATIKAAESYRDISWLVVGRHLGLALTLIVLSRINPGFGLSPWLLLAGVCWLGYALRMTMLKTIDQTAARRR